jgi:hypothetical protein
MLMKGFGRWKSFMVKAATTAKKSGAKKKPATAGKKSAASKKRRCCSPCSNTLTIAAAEATVSWVSKGIFKAPQWIKSSNDRK